MRQIALLLLVSLLACATASVETTTFAGEVVGVHDGDSLTLLVDSREMKIRLAEIDAPERGQPFGRKSKQALSDKVFAKPVSATVVTTDHWGRTVAHVWVEGRHVNREMIAEGWAWAFDEYLRDETLREDHNKAKASRRGLWSADDAMPPWEWRRARREARKSK